MRHVEMLDNDWALFELDDRRSQHGTWRAYRVVCVGDEPERMRVNVRLSKRRKFDIGWNGERLSETDGLDALRLRYPHFESKLVELLTSDYSTQEKTP